MPNTPAVAGAKKISVLYVLREDPNSYHLFGVGDFFFALFE